MSENPFEKLREINPSLYALFERAASAVINKNHDYAGEGQDFYRNLKSSERWGFPGWKSVFVRIGDKISRIESFLMQEDFAVKDETLVDTCVDGAVYLFMMADMWLKSKLGKTVSNVPKSLTFKNLKDVTYIPFGPSTSEENNA